MNNNQVVKSLEEVVIIKRFQEVVKAICLKRKNESEAYDVMEDEVEIEVEMYRYEYLSDEQTSREGVGGIIIKLIQCPYLTQSGRECCNISENGLPKAKTPDTKSTINCHVYNPPLGHSTKDLIKW